MAKLLYYYWTDYYDEFQLHEEYTTGTIAFIVFIAMMINFYNKKYILKQFYDVLSVDGNSVTHS